MSKALAVLLELKESASYWSEYDVPIGIHERIDEAIEELTTKPEKFNPIDEEELVVWYSQNVWSLVIKEYMLGFRDAEKCYQITGEVK
jgi:hypothetical protein